MGEENITPPPDERASSPEPLANKFKRTVKFSETTVFGGKPYAYGSDPNQPENPNIIVLRRRDMGRWGTTTLRDPQDICYIVRTKLSDGKTTIDARLADYRPVPDTLTQAEIEKYFDREGYRTLPDKPEDRAAALRDIERAALAREVELMLAQRRADEEEKTRNLTAKLDELSKAVPTSAAPQVVAHREPSGYSGVMPDRTMKTDAELRVEQSIGALVGESANFAKVDNSQLFGSTERTELKEVEENYKKLDAFLLAQAQKQTSENPTNAEEILAAARANQRYLLDRFTRFKRNRSYATVAGINPSQQVERFFNTSVEFAKIPDDELFDFASVDWAGTRITPEDMKSRFNHVFSKASSLIQDLNSIDFTSLGLRGSEIEEAQKAVLITGIEYLADRFNRFKVKKFPALFPPPKPKQ